MSDAFAEVRDLYQQVILDRGRTPRHAGRPESFDASARGDNPLCGDRVEVFVRRTPAGTLAGTPRFVARGCAVCVASSDLMAEAVADRDPATIHALADAVEAMADTGACPEHQGDPAVSALGALAAVHAYPSRRRCVTLPWTALIAAIDTTPEPC